MTTHNPNLVVLNHPLALHFLSHLRDKTTKPPLFRTLTKKLSLLLAIEAAKDFPNKIVNIETPLQTTAGKIIQEELVVIPILRAGLGMLDPFLDLFPNVRVGYIGIQRDHTTALPQQYYANIPNLKDKVVYLIDPMLATGGSAAYAIQQIKLMNPKLIVLITILSAPEGVASVHAQHPEIKIVTSALDDCLNSQKYIVPGLGDCGDRLYGTEACTNSHNE